MKKINLNYIIILTLYFVFNNSLNAQITKINIKETPKPEQKYDSLTIVAIIQNSKNEQTTIPFDVFSNDRLTTPLKLAEKYKRKFGVTIYNLIMKGKVRIGMSKEMCRISWGEPNDINSTISSGRNSEQWVYDENYLYFDNGILKTIQ